MEVLYPASEKPGGGTGDVTSHNNSPLKLAQILLCHWPTGLPISTHNEGPWKHMACRVHRSCGGGHSGEKGLEGLQFSLLCCAPRELLGKYVIRHSGIVGFLEPLHSLDNKERY